MEARLTGTEPPLRPPPPKKKQYATVSGNYSLAATYCTPDGGPGKALQILTHGVGFDRSYWDYPIDGHRYSYVGAATARNYSTFAYDRLGIGESSRGADPVDEIQSALEVAALRALTLGLRGAALPGVPDAYGTTFHVGHSYGSIQTYGLTAGAAGDGEVVSDGIALTGFSMASQFLPYFLLGGNFVSASPGTAQKNVTTAASSSSSSSSSSSYGYGYFAAGDAAAVQTNFFAPGMFDPDVLEAATRTGQPVTVGELLTLGQPVSGCSNGFEGPVLVVTGGKSSPPPRPNRYLLRCRRRPSDVTVPAPFPGALLRVRIMLTGSTRPPWLLPYIDRDLPFCGGNCSATPGLSVPAMVQSNFTNASDFETLIVPSGGHALNLVSYEGLPTVLIDPSVGFWCEKYPR